MDYSERHGYVKGVVKSIEHDPGRGAPIMRVQYRHAFRNCKTEAILVAPEGVYSGQFVYSGAKAELAVGNILPIGQLPEGAFGAEGNDERVGGQERQLSEVLGLPKQSIARAGVL